MGRKSTWEIRKRKKGMGEKAKVETNGEEKYMENEIKKEKVKKRGERAKGSEKEKGKWKKESEM